MDRQEDIEAVVVAVWERKQAGDFLTPAGPDDVSVRAPNGAQFSYVAHLYAAMVMQAALDGPAPAQRAMLQVDAWATVIRVDWSAGRSLEHFPVLALLGEEWDRAFPGAATQYHLEFPQGVPWALADLGLSFTGAKRPGTAEEVAARRPGRLPGQPDPVAMQAEYHRAWNATYARGGFSMPTSWR